MNTIRNGGDQELLQSTKIDLCLTKRPEGILEETLNRRLDLSLIPVLPCPCQV